MAKPLFSDDKVLVAGKSRGMSLRIFSSFPQEREDDGKGREDRSCAPSKRQTLELEVPCVHLSSAGLAEDSLGKLCASLLALLHLRGHF